MTDIHTDTRRAENLLAVRASASEKLAKLLDDSKSRGPWCSLGPIAKDRIALVKAALAMAIEDDARATGKR